MVKKVRVITAPKQNWKCKTLQVLALDVRSTSQGAARNPSKGAAYNPICDTFNVTLKMRQYLPLAEKEELAYSCFTSGNCEQNMH